MAVTSNYGTGRRKTSTARVFLRPGTGQIVVNRKPVEHHFPTQVLQLVIRNPLVLTETVDKFDVLATTTQKVRPGDPWHREVTSPAVWTRHWGDGRIFVATPGHSVAVLQDANVRTIIERGLLWASR